MYEKLRKAIDSGLFSKDLTDIVSPPSLEEITARQNELPLLLRPEHVQLLLEWGGSNLDEVRINGLRKLKCDDTFVEFANDYNGFIYKYARNGTVHAEDTDGGLIQQIALSVPEFINDVFLGERCVAFYGDDWLAELRKHNLI